MQLNFSVETSLIRLGGQPWTRLLAGRHRGHDDGKGDGRIDRILRDLRKRIPSAGIIARGTRCRLASLVKIEGAPRPRQRNRPSQRARAEQQGSLRAAVQLCSIQQQDMA